MDEPSLNDADDETNPAPTDLKDAQPAGDDTNPAVDGDPMNEIRSPNTLIAVDVVANYLEPMDDMASPNTQVAGDIVPPVLEAHDPERPVVEKSASPNTQVAEESEMIVPPAVVVESALEANEPQQPLIQNDISSLTTKVAVSIETTVAHAVEVPEPLIQNTGAEALPEETKVVDAVDVANSAAPELEHLSDEDGATEVLNVDREDSEEFPITVSVEESPVAEGEEDLPNCVHCNELIGGDSTRFVVTQIGGSFERAWCAAASRAIQCAAWHALEKDWVATLWQRIGSAGNAAL